MTAAEIRALRLSLGLSQAQAAARIGVTKRAWQYYEANERKIPEPTARLLRRSTGRRRRKAK